MFTPHAIEAYELRPQAAAAPSFRAHTVAYRHTETPFVAADVSLADASAALAQRVGEEARLYATNSGPVDDYVVTSTVLSQFLADNSPHAEQFRAGIGATYGRIPDWITNAYECTGWGFILRYVMQKARLTGPRRLLLQIVDTDIHNFGYWIGTSRWGKSGFGICTLLIEVTPGADDMLTLGSASQAHALVQMGRSLRSFSESRPGVSIALPFFPEMSRRALFKCFDTSLAHGDHYQRFGHSFGSDPWLSVLTELDSGSLKSGQDCIVSSLALNGYFSIAQVALAPQLRHALEGKS
ncbi:MAG: hypothetical protein WBD81_07410 [Collimonas pratensis]|uniref:hypothetical protein n=1 Tax=Collimonas pratensis TaxID=279113 RepID=UPI003C78FAB4